MPRDDQKPGARPPKRVPVARRGLGRVQPAVDLARPIHVAIAEPWSAFQRGGDADQARWDLPDGIEVGDTVITLVDAREWVVARVSVWIETISVGALHTVEPSLRDGASLAAVERRVRIAVPRRAETVSPKDAAALIAAIKAEAGSPTPWRTLNDACYRAHDEEALATAHVWGCRGCGRDTSRRFAPRFETHVAESYGTESWPSPIRDVVAVCPSCHDILHHPLGPSVDELMFSNRPACPECAEYQAFSILRGFPPGPPPSGTRLYGCSITDIKMTRWVCGACDAEW